DAISDDDLPKPDVLKMDIQGGELAVLQNGRIKLIDAVCIIPEVRFFRIYEGEPMWSDVDMELRMQGFVLHKLMPTKAIPVGNSLRSKMRSKHFRNQLVDGDAVYIRDPSTIEDWTDEQVKQLTIAAAGVFNSLDLVIYCMDQLVARGVLPPQAPKAFFKTLPKWIKK
ncbi:MAG: FkbM family methyltransferase, partial [Sulfitobacter sp.]